MRPREQETYDVQSNMITESRELSVKINSLPHLMKLLTDLYSDPIMAVIREYPSNAWDSHQAAHNNAPIEITLPTPLHATFVVQDYGVGMSKDDLFDIYSSYGESTKRETDDEVGMLGLGCKSALTYTDQFIIRAVKDGILINATMGRNAKGGGVLSTIGDPVPVNEVDGVRISISVSDVEAFRQKAMWYFSWWEKGSVVVDGKEPDPPAGIQISPEFMLHQRDFQQRYQHDFDVIIMGNVPYKLSDKQLSRRLGYNVTVSARVPIGTVDPVPSREQLHYTDRTKAAITTIETQVYDAVTAYAQKEIDNAPSATDAVYIKRRWMDGAHRLNLNVHYQGNPVPSEVDVVDTAFHYQPHGDYHAKRSGNKIYIEDFFRGNRTIVTGYPKNELTSSRDRLKLRTWAEETDGVSDGSFFVVNTMPGSPWTDGLTTYKWEDVAATKVGSSTTKTGQPSGVQVLMPPPPGQGYKYGDLNDVTDAIEKILVSPAVEVNPMELARLFIDSAIVILAKNRWDKFIRENNNAFTAEQKLEERIITIDAKLPDAAYLSAAGYPPFGQRFHDLELDKIDDPKLKEYFKLHVAIADDDDVKNLQTEIRHLSMVYRQTKILTKDARHVNTHNSNLPDGLGERKSVQELAQLVAERYPFLRHHRYGKLDDHSYEYVNALYAVKYQERKIAA